MAAAVEQASGLPPDELALALIETPARLQLTASVINAAVRSVDDEKLKVLGRLLCEGAIHHDDSVMASDALLVAALAEVSKPHISVLDELYPRNLRA